MDYKNLTDIQLIKKIKSKADSDAYLELKQRNEKCYYNTAASYCRKAPKLLNYKDLVEDVDYIIQKSINSYDARKKTKFSTWLCSQSRFHLLNTLTKKNELGIFSYEDNSTLDLLNNSFNNHHTDKNEDIKDHVFQVLDSLGDKRIKEIFKLRYYSSKTEQKWRHISKKLKLSTQQCLNLMAVGKKALYKSFVKNY